MKKYHISYADWTSREFGALARCLLTGRVNQGPDIARLQERLQMMYAPSQVFLLNYAHHGIGLALRMLAHQRPERSQVIVPAYICPSVPQAVAAVGLQVRYVDVGDDLNLSLDSVRQALNADTLAVIAPHMYACPAPIEAIEALCSEAGVFLVDDAAQVVGVRVGGRLLGTFGDVGVISFAQSKTVVTGIRGSGGVLLVNRPVWVDELGQLCGNLPSSSSRLGPLADFLWNHVGRPYTGHTGYYLGRLFGLEPAAPPTAAQISHLEASIALVQLGRLDALLAEKTQIAQLYHQALQAYPRIQFPQFSPGRYLARVMLRLPQGASVSAVRSRALRLGVETRSGYAVHVPSDVIAPQAEAFAQRLVGVPCRNGMTESDAHAICAALDASLADNG